MQYVAPASGKRPVETWFAEIPREARQRFLDMLAKATKERAWRAPEFKRLKGGFVDFGEFRVSADNTQWRLIGRVGRQIGEFTLLIGCSHKQRRYDPPSALETAARRWSEIGRGDARVVEFGSGS